ncbi:MAG: transglutaminase-like domain-containing protein [Flammeovirgaceae bacterium]|nr:transglutaminase-like domain-containing protein [Flammeovirgaceae bacterium]MDW8286855.1 transglutaminase-like domain-containing protein [Flammeovirgaceae bacterium]
MNESEIYALISLLDDDDIEVREHVLEKILLLGEKILPYLQSFLKQHPTKEPLQKVARQIHLQYLAKQLKTWKNTESHDLLKGVWIANLYHQPDLSLEKLQKEIEQLFYEAWINFRLNLYPLDEVRILNESFFEKMGFRGNFLNFHAIDNSLLETVLTTRRGNPISLCILYMLIAQKLRLPIKGANIPNIFMLIYQTPRFQFYINVFNGGAILSQEEVKHYIINELKVPNYPEYYKPCSHVDIVRRVMKNMQISYEKNQESEKFSEIGSLITHLDIS